MSSRGKTDTAVIVLIGAVCVLACAWATAAFGFGFGGLRHWLWGGHDFRPFLPVFSLGTLISLALAIWVGFDANRRGMNGLLWGLLVFFTSIVGLIVNLIVASATNGRTPVTPTATCTGCGSRIETGFKVCPFCGRSTQTACPGCKRPTAPDWKVCPYCSTSLTPAPPSPTEGTQETT